MNDIILVGAGGFGREVLWQIKEHCSKDFNVIGFVDNSPELIGQSIEGVPVLGNDEWLAGYQNDVSVAICIASPKIRKDIYNTLRTNPKISYPTIIANNVIYSKNVQFGQGCIVCVSSLLTINVSLGDFVIINPSSKIAHDSSLGDFVTLYYSVNIAGNVKINNGVEIGTGTTIIQQKTIGENSVIGAGAVVVKDIPANCVAMGVPAKPMIRTDR